MILGAFVVCLSLLKPIYLMFALFAVLLPAELFADWRHRVRVLGLALAAGLAVAVAWNLSYPFVPGAYWGTGADPGLHLRTLLTDPVQAIAVFLTTLRVWPHAWWLGSTISFGGHGAGYSTNGSFQYTALVLAIILAAAVAEAGKRTDRTLAGVSLFLAFSYVTALLLAFWVGFTPAGATQIAGIQGRYFMLAYLLMAFAILAALPPLRVPSRIRNLVLGAGLATHASGLVFAVQWMQGRWIP